eukprot:9236660-Alexandrium_andersonii.AAC.1
MPSISMPVSTPPPLFSAMALAVRLGAPFGPPPSDEAAMFPRRAALSAQPPHSPLRTRPTCASPAAKSTTQLK